MSAATRPEPGPDSLKPVVDRRADMRRNHWGLYLLPCMAVLNSVIVLIFTLSVFALLGCLLGVASFVVHYHGGKATKIRFVLAFEFGMVALALGSFLLTSNS